jgi:Uma2 family endonuclease
MATVVETPREQRFVLRDVSWTEYQGIAETLGERHLRLTFDRGSLEFTTLSHGHERYSNLLGRFVEVITEELDVPLQSGGSTTFGREDLERGIEPDQCYYLENEPLVRDKDEIDLAVDPPPDLAIEVDVSRRSLNRMGIYAALRVREVWRFDGETLRAYRLNKRGSYVEVTQSQHFPFLSLAKVAEFLGRRTEMDETSLVRAFRRWVRGQIAKRK